MKCNVCLEEFNQAERVPKNVPCGHTVCLQCLQRSGRRECPTCRRVLDVAPDALPDNLYVLQQIEPGRPDRPARGWCSDCRAAAAPSCWDKEHDVLPEKSALMRHLQGALRQAAGHLAGLQDQCQGEQAGQALTLLTADSCSLTVKAGDQELTGNVENSEDPLTQLMWLLVATKAGLSKSRAEARRPPAAPAEAWPVGEMDMAKVSRVSFTKPWAAQKEKAALLAEAPEVGVTLLVHVWCKMDPAWSLHLLQRAAPTLERLHVMAPREGHLLAVHGMPRLRRLTVDGADVFPEPRPPLELPALPPGHGLRWLRVSGLPRAWTQSLLRAHGATLEELDLTAGTAEKTSYSVSWPGECHDLHSLLQKCGLRALRRLVLTRDVYEHKTDACSKQRAKVRKVLRGAEVLCDKCDIVEWQNL